MAAYLHWEGVGRTLYGSVKLRRFLWMHLFGVGAFAAGVLVTLAVPLVVRVADLRTTVTVVTARQETIELLVICLLFPILFLSVFLQHRIATGNHRASPE